MTTILVGTSNPSKVRFFQQFIEQEDVRLVTPGELGIGESPEENGRTPVENAVLKAEFYGQYAPCAVCADSGLYFDELPLDDPRQPGLHIRTPQGIRLDDEEMIAYYSQLIHTLGGKVLAYYLDGIAVYRDGKIESFLDEQGKAAAFYMVDTPSPNRHPGWPLDSLSLNKNTMTYFTDHGNNIYDNVEEQIMVGQYRQRVVNFLKQALGLK